MRSGCFATICAVYLAGVLTFAGGQTAPPTPTRDPQALLLLSQALAHLRSAPGPVADLTLTANVTYTAGSDHEAGEATLEALAAEQSRVTLNLDGGTREQVRNGIAGAWVGKDGVAHASALHNCWAGASWFAPLLVLEAASTDPAVSVTLGNTGVTAGPADSHSREGGNPGVTLSRVIPNQSAGITAEIQKLGTMTLYLDASTLLPAELDFNLHPDNNDRRDIPVEIRFSDYRPVSGVLIPFHIQKYIQNSLLLDLQVTTVTLNSGLTPSDFAHPAVAAATGGKP